jgi:hypothetical protein
MHKLCPLFAVLASGFMLGSFPQTHITLTLILLVGIKFALANTKLRQRSDEDKR